MQHSADCPWCQTAMRPWLLVPGDWRRPRAAASHPLVRCDACGYGALAVIPAAHEIAAFYDVEGYGPHRGARGSPSTAMPAPGLIERLRVRLAWQFDRGEDLGPEWITRRCGPAPLSICDLGCGGGELAAALRSAGHRVVGVEPSPTGRAAAAARGVTVHAGTAEDLPTAVTSQRFDVVVLFHVLEHCRDPLRALRNARMLLAPGGRAVIEVPNNECRGLATNGIAWHFLDVPRHLHFFTAASLVRACEDAGLDHVDTAWCGYTRQFQAPWLATEREIARALGSRVGSPWPLLLTTLLAADRDKYDSVRVLAD